MTNINRSYSISDDNGCIFCLKYYIPEEVLSIILSCVPPKDLVFTCRLVCKYWCNVIDSQVWRIKFGKENLPVSKVRDLPWFACYWMVLKNPFERNLVKNSCGEDGLKHWKLVSNQGDRWKVEKTPQGCGDFPNEMGESEGSGVQSFTSCFATSYNSCSKEQIIDLKAEGAVPQIMDMLQPKITVSEWYCGRSDSRCIYEFKTAILDEHQNPIDEYEIRKNLDKPEGTSWQKITHTFQNYGEGVRFVWIYHFGQDLMFWKGHFGNDGQKSSEICLCRASNTTSVVNGNKRTARDGKKRETLHPPPKRAGAEPIGIYSRPVPRRDKGPYWGFTPKLKNVKREKEETRTDQGKSQSVGGELETARTKITGVAAHASRLDAHKPIPSVEYREGEI